MATWSCLRTPPGDPVHLSLQEVWDIAARVAGKDHGFRSALKLVAMLSAWCHRHDDGYTPEALHCGCLVQCPILHKLAPQCHSSMQSCGL
jgi:hypothetical protein